MNGPGIDLSPIFQRCLCPNQPCLLPDVIYHYKPTPAGPFFTTQKKEKKQRHTHTSLNRLSKLFSQRPSLYVNSAHLEPWPRYFDQTTEKIFEAFTASWSSGNRRVLEPFVFVTKRRERARQTSDTSLHQFGFWF